MTLLHYYQSLLRWLHTPMKKCKRRCWGKWKIQRMQSSRISQGTVILGVWEMVTLSSKCHGGRWTAPCENRCKMLTSCKCCLLFIWQREVALVSRMWVKWSMCGFAGSGPPSSLFSRRWKSSISSSAMLNLQRNCCCCFEHCLRLKDALLSHLNIKRLCLFILFGWVVGDYRF